MVVQLDPLRPLSQVAGITRFSFASMNEPSMPGTRPVDDAALNDRSRTKRST